MSHRIPSVITKERKISSYPLHVVVGIRVRVCVFSVRVDRGRHWVPSFTALFSVTHRTSMGLATSKPQISSCLPHPLRPRVHSCAQTFPWAPVAQAQVLGVAGQHFRPQAPFCKIPKSHSCLLEHKRKLIITCGNHTSQFTGRWLNFACKPVAVL